ncbi:MAG: LPS assembly protein LptD [Deltaproteobacteria bacterium]|nr:LPS assembly protein LptD [Deltaproteobacteria bacterium]
MTRRNCIGIAACIAVFFAAFIAVSPSFCAEPAKAEPAYTKFFKSDLPIEISGDNVNYDKATDTYRAEGSVVIEQEGIRLTADKVNVDMKNGLASASGHVKIVYKDESFVEAESLDIVMKDETAVFVSARVYYKEDNIYISADELKKTGPESYSAKGASFTTCDCAEGETPPWSFYTTGASVTVGRTFKARGAFFRIKSVPVFYLPYVSIPVNRERQSGLLAPRFSYSKLGGAGVDNSLFWNISDSRDATFYLDIDSKRGLGTGLEYRYFNTANSFGNMRYYNYRESDIERIHKYRADQLNYLHPLSADNDRQRFYFDHTLYGANGLSFKAKLDIVSDDEYFLDFGRNFNEKSLESVESVISVTKAWDRSALVIQGRRFDNLYVQNDSGVASKFPEAMFTMQPHRVWFTPFFMSMDAQAARFDRRAGVEGVRGDVRPEFTLPVYAGPIEFTPFYAPRYTAYKSESAAAGSNTDERLIYETGAKLESTLYRTFELGEGRFRRLGHMMRPSIKYSYIPDEPQGDLPYFDAVDRVEARSLVTYAFRTILSARLSDKGPRLDVVDFEVRQSYDIREAQGLNNSIEERPFSDVLGRLHLRPERWATMFFETEIDAYTKRADIFKSSASFAPYEGYSLSLNYIFERGVARYGAASALFKLYGNLSAGFTERYSFKGDVSLGRDYIVEYKHKCWSAAFVYEERPEEDSVMLTFSLGGIGEILTAGMGLGSK